MTPDDFERLKATAIAAGAEARTEIVAGLLGLSAEELARLDPEFWSQIDPDGRERLLAGLAGEPPTSAPARHGASHSMRTVSAAALSWRSWPPAARAVVVGAAAWAACILTGLASLVTISPSGPWDGRYAICRRLDDIEPHCTYRVQGDLAWRDAAARADVDAGVLHRSNPSLTGPGIPAGALLHIDRPSAPPSFDELLGRHNQ